MQRTDLMTFLTSNHRKTNLLSSRNIQTLNLSYVFRDGLPAKMFRSARYSFNIHRYFNQPYFILQTTGCHAFGLVIVSCFILKGSPSPVTLCYFLSWLSWWVSPDHPVDLTSCFLSWCFWIPARAASSFWFVLLLFYVFNSLWCWF